MAARQKTDWAEFIPDKQWEFYQQVIDEATNRNIDFALGGAFAMAIYTGFWRDTKDLDLYVLPEKRDEMVDVLTSVGLNDYYETKPYDRWWIYRGARECDIVDVIWAMANHRAEIDDLWMSGPQVDLRGRRLKVLPPEALFWDKLYIMQRERCDWPDVLNLLHEVGPELSWEYLLYRIGDDYELVAGVLSVFRWISPGRSKCLPDWLWERVGLSPQPAQQLEQTDKRRVSLLDTRPWYGPDRNKLAA